MVGQCDLFLDREEECYPGVLVDGETIEFTIGVREGAQIDDRLCPAMMSKLGCIIVSVTSGGGSGGSRALESAIRPAPLSRSLTTRMLIHRVWVPSGHDENLLTITWPLLIAQWHLRPVEQVVEGVSPIIVLRPWAPAKLWFIKQLVEMVLLLEYLVGQCGHPEQIRQWCKLHEEVEVGGR